MSSLNCHELMSIRCKIQDQGLSLKFVWEMVAVDTIETSQILKTLKVMQEIVNKTFPIFYFEPGLYNYYLVFMELHPVELNSM